MYRNDGIKKIAIVDFDVHHGNGTEEILRRLAPKSESSVVRTPFAVGALHTAGYKPWLDETDMDDVFFASTHGYGPRDRQPLYQMGGAVQGGWFYPASGETFRSRSLDGGGGGDGGSKPEVPPLHDFLLSQTWTRLGEDYRNNCCKIIDIGLSLPARDDTYGHGRQRLELRDAYRLNVLPALVEFDPDIIFISAGFDAHRRDTMNFGYVGMIEEDFEWLTDQLLRVANTCCGGRVVSALEGGYKTHGGIVSPFARSVASHVRALVDGGRTRERYDEDEARWESGFENRLNEEKEKRRQMKLHRSAGGGGGSAQSRLSPAAPRPTAAEADAAAAERTALVTGDLVASPSHPGLAEGDGHGPPAADGGGGDDPRVDGGTEAAAASESTVMMDAAQHLLASPPHVGVVLGQQDVAGSASAAAVRSAVAEAIATTSSFDREEMGDNAMSLG